MGLNGISILFEKEKKMKNSPKTKLVLVIFYAILIGVMLGYAWRLHHENISVVETVYEYLNKEN